MKKGGGEGKKVPVYNMNVKKECPKSVSKKWVPKRQHPFGLEKIFRR